MTREERRAILVRDFGAMRAKVARLDARLLAEYPTADAARTKALKAEAENAHGELKKLERRVNGGGRKTRHEAAQLEWCK